MSSSDETGLNLFHDNASAAGTFPTSLRGSDRASVDEYVRTLERRTGEVQHRNRELDQRARQLEDELAKAQQSSAPPEVQATGRAGDVLRAADTTAREVVKKAQLEAEQIKEAARREASATRGHSDRTVIDYQNSQRAEIDGLRKRVQTDAIAQVTKARDEGGSIVAAARREVEALRLQTNQEINAHRENSRLQAGAMLAQAQREAAELRAALAKEREQQAGALKAAHADASVKVSALLTEAQQFHAASGEQLAQESAEAARIRTEALAEAERTRIRVAREAEEIIGNAKRQAETLQQRMHEQFTQGKDRLRRETELLNDRKKAVLAQLASLSEWAQQGAAHFPEGDSDDDLDDLDSAFGGQSGADGSADSATGPVAETGNDAESEDGAETGDDPSAPQASTEAAEATHVTNGTGGNDGPGAAADQPQTDPDATAIRIEPAR